MLNVILLGLVSFFSDLSAEMVYPIIPLYLTAAFGATPALVGVIEGVAESAASLLKVFSGYITDKYKNKKAVAAAGYATGLVYKIALLFAGSWAGILLARVIDRFGKGVRTAPRDVMVAESADGKNMGVAFGIHKALDMAGSAAGILASYILLTRFVGDSFAGYKNIFALSIIPIAIALIIFPFIREKRGERSIKKREHFWRGIAKIDGRLRLYLLVSVIFTLGNSSNTFLLLRAKNVGFDDTSVILLYLLYNAAAALLSVPFGKMSDKIGRKRLLVAGYVIFAAVYAGFAFADSNGMIIATFALYGVFAAMTAGVERAFISEIAPPDMKGTMLGLQATATGIALLPASAVAGLLWNAFGAPAPFIFGASLSLIAAVILGVFLKNPTKQYEVKK